MGAEERETLSAVDLAEEFIDRDVTGPQRKGPDHLTPEHHPAVPRPTPRRTGRWVLGLAVPLLILGGIVLIGAPRSCCSSRSSSVQQGRFPRAAEFASGGKSTPSAPSGPGGLEVTFAIDAAIGDGNVHAKRHAQGDIVCDAHRDTEGDPQLDADRETLGDAAGTRDRLQRLPEEVRGKLQGWADLVRADD